jgi:cystathionine beta-synthase
VIYSSIYESVGNTPLIRVFKDIHPNILAKLEYLNPGGSVKDRSALYMIEQAERDGILQPGGTIVDASSGNQGIATAMIGAAKGYKVIIVISDKSSQEKIKALRAFGAQVVTVPPTLFLEDPNSYHSKAMEIHKNTPNSFMPNQYFNTANAMGHYHSLGPEIWRQTEGKITHFISAVGTGGNVSGAGKYLKEQNPDVQVIAVDSNNSFRATKGNPKPYKIEGMGVDFDSPVLNYDVIDEFYEVADEPGLAMLKELAHHEGILVGPSSGAVAYAGKMYAQKLPKDAIAVLVLGDSGRAYLSKDFYS